MECSHRQKGVERPRVRDPDLRDIISSIVNNKAGTPSGAIFPGKLSVRGEGHGKAGLTRNAKLALVKLVKHGKILASSLGEVSLSSWRAA